MAHMFDSGFSVRERPWHGLGNIPQEYPGNWAAARTLAGLDWDPVEVAAYEVGELFPDGRATVELIPDFKQIKRSDDNRRLAIVRDGHELITHDVFGEIFEALQDKSDGEVLYETAGSLDEGRKVWVLSRLGQPRQLPGDPSLIQPYMALLTSHDGSAALRVIGTMVRIVCWNTWHAADMDASRRGTSYSFKHTKNWRTRVEHAKAALANTHETIDYTFAEAAQMLRQRVNARQAKWFIREFAVHRTISNTIARDEVRKHELEERLAQPRVQTSLNKTVDALNRIMESPTTQGIRGSVYGLVQAAGEFTDHVRDTGTRESYFSRTMLSEREGLKLTAVKLAREAVKQ